MKVEFEKDDAAKPGEVTLMITMCGDATKIAQALVHGFPREALEQMQAAFTAEMAKRQEPAPASK